MNDCASEETSNAKDKLLANLKKEVKKIVEECVMLKCVHEESAGVTSLCVSVDACLSYGLRRRALGLFKTSSTTALIQKLAKECEDANHVVKKVEEAEIAQGNNKRTYSAGDSASSGSLYKGGSKSSRLEKTHSGSNLAAFTPRYLWIRIALFEKRLQQIVVYLVSQSDKYYTKDSLVGDSDYSPILSNLLVGPAALEFTKVKTYGQMWSDLPANELVQRHKISSVGSSGSLTSSSTASQVSPRVIPEHGFDMNTSNPINLTISPLHQVSYRRSLSHTPSVASTLAFEEKSLVPSQAREYVESLHQNQKDVLIYGKNNVKVAPKDKDTFLAGYLSFHQIITHLGNVSGQQQETTLVLKWTPNQLMNGHTTQEKSASWQQALYIDLKTILFIHCHQDHDEPGKLILVASDGIQHPPIEFPSGFQEFLSCLESSLQSEGGRLDPPLSTLQDPNSPRLETTKSNGASSADIAKAKRRFPWLKKEVQSEELEASSIKEENPELKAQKVDWVFKVQMPSDEVVEKAEKKPMSLLLPKSSKLSGSREWLTNLFSPNKTSKEKTEEEVNEAEDDLADEQIAIEINGITLDQESMEENDQESQIKRKSPSEPISSMCSSMRRQIISRAFYGWLSHRRHMKIIRKHLGDLTYKEAPMVPNPQWHEGVTPSWLASIDWQFLRQNPDALQAFEREIDWKIYLGGIEASLRKEVWPYILGHYKWSFTPEDKVKADQKVKVAYENRLSDWMAIEAIVRQRDRETTAACIAKLAGLENGNAKVEKTSSSHHQTFNISNEVFEEEELSSRTVSEYDKISTITEATENSISISPSKNPRGKINSTNSEPSRSSNGSKTTKAEKLAYFRAKVTSADDEGIGFDTLQVKSGQNGSGSLKNPDECDSSETEGEDLISEIEELSKHGSSDINPCNGNACQDSETSVSYKVTTPSIDSGNPSASNNSPTRNGNHIDIEQAENFEADMALITQKIDTLCVSNCASPASSEGGTFPQELIDNFALNLHRIDKDVQRCDRNHPYFTTLPNLEKLRNIITTYVWENLDVGYMQGMCDIVAPLLVVFNEESLTHQCFAFLMERMLCNFPHGNQMDENFANMRSLIQILDQTLYDTIQKNGDFSHFYFCYRWFLLDFKREFAYCDIFLVWETIWASRKVTSSHFYLFVALALVENYRDIILDRNMDFTDIIKFFNEMAEKHDGRSILTIARELVHQLQTINADQ